MIKYFQKAFKITNDNIILTTPMVLFLFLLSIYLGIAHNLPPNLFSAILLLVTIICMIGAFCAGWFFMIKKAIDLEKKEFIMEEDKAKESFALIKEIPIGIGEYFLNFIGGLILYSAMFGLLIVLGYLIGNHLIGNIGLNIVDLKNAMDSPVAMKSLISSLSNSQLMKLNLWNLLFIILMALFSFVTMFWSAEIIYKTKNPLLALFRSIRFIFNNFLGTLIMFIYISFINFIVSLFNAFSVIHPILYFVSMLVYFYFIVYIVVLVFSYYDAQKQA